MEQLYCTFFEITYSLEKNCFLYLLKTDKIRFPGLAGALLSGLNFKILGSA